MRKRLACLLAAMMLCLCFPAFAAPGTQAVTANLGDWMDRVKLRASPSQEAAVLGQYFGDVQVTVLETGTDWSRVSVGGREGYMMSRYLAAPAGDEAQGIPGAVAAAQSNLPVYAEPDAGSAVLGTLPEGTVSVLGTVGEKWLHVLYTGGGAALTGFASSEGITQSENFSSATVLPSEPGVRVHLRAAPNQAAVSLGLYYGGARVALLFDDHTNGDGWARVRILDAVGYMMERFLDDSSGGMPRYRPSLTTSKHESIPIFAGVNDELAADMLARGERAAVLGSRGTRYAVRITSGASYRYGYVEQASVEPVGGAASTACTVLARQPLYLSDGQGGVLPNTLTAPALAKAYLYGSAQAKGGPVSDGYVEPGAQWLYVSVDLQEGSWADGYLPRDAVNFDSALACPVY